MAKIEIEKPSCPAPQVIYPRFALTPTGRVWVQMRENQKWWLLLAGGELGVWRIGDQIDNLAAEHILPPSTKLHITVE